MINHVQVFLPDKKMDNPRENGLSTIESIDANNEVDSSMKTEKEDTMVRKNKGVDFSQALVSQTEAARECAKDEIRRFVRVPVEVETIGGKPLIFNMWASEEKPIHRKRTVQVEAQKDCFSCELCKKNFDSGKKLQQHLKNHKDSSSGSDQSTSYACSVCGKKFDEQRKLTLHFRYHKVGKPGE